MKKPKTALIGAGNMGKNHARVYSEISNFVGIADVIEEIGKPLAAKFAVPYFKSYKEMIAAVKPEAISVVVPTKFHNMVTLDCLNAKIPTLVEKPIAATVDEAKGMVATARKNKTFLMVGHVERFNPAVQKLKSLVESGELGEVVSIQATRVGIAPPKIPNSCVALDLGIHDVDVCNYLLNEHPLKSLVHRKKLVSSNVSDAATIILEYKNCTASIHTNWITPIKIRTLAVTGTKGFAHIDYIKQKLVVYDKILELKPLESFYEVVSLADQPRQELYISRKEPLRQELLYFLKNRESSDYSLAEDAISALEVVM